MYVHLGKGCLICTSGILGIFSMGDNHPSYKNLKNEKGKFYEIVNLCEEEVADSMVITNEKIYLSAISAITLHKRIRKNIIFNDGGNNGRKK